tara:strand:- start:2617 stop:3561 length:945 start_codon:yes stop_codon:yes gene_type:complete
LINDKDSMKLTISILVFFFSILVKFSLLASENRILLKVNNELITTIDILNEISYLKSINKNINDLEEKKVIEIARNSLIKDKIKKITLIPIVEKIEINDDDFKRVLISNYSNTGLTKIEEISEHLKKYDVKAHLVREKITINAIWSQFIYDKYSKNIKIDVEKLKQSIQRSENQTEYLLSEIVFDLKEKQTLNEKLNIIENAIQKNGFENTALIYSISETANSSGYIGWVNENSINKKILDEITKISINGITKPLVIPGGYLILKLKEKRTKKKDIDIEDELKRIIQIKTNEQLNQFSNIYLNKIKKDIVINEL